MSSALGRVWIVSIAVPPVSALAGTARRQPPRPRDEAWIVDLDRARPEVAATPRRRHRAVRSRCRSGRTRDGQCPTTRRLRCPPTGCRRPSPTQRPIERIAARRRQARTRDRRARRARSATRRPRSVGCQRVSARTCAEVVDHRRERLHRDPDRRFGRVLERGQRVECRRRRPRSECRDRRASSSASQASRRSSTRTRSRGPLAAGRHRRNRRRLRSRGRGPARRRGSGSRRGRSHRGV